MHSKTVNGPVSSNAHESLMTLARLLTCEQPPQDSSQQRKTCFVGEVNAKSKPRPKRATHFTVAVKSGIKSLKMSRKLNQVRLFVSAVEQRLSTAAA